MAFKSMLRRKGVRVVSITEHAEHSPTGKLIESVEEFYSENLAQEVTRGMRESTSRGFFLGSKAPFGYRRVKVNDGAKKRPTLEVDPTTASIVREVFGISLRGNGLKEICKALNERGITNRGKRWYKGGLYYPLANEAYTGTAVWGRTSKGQGDPDPVRVEGAWPVLVSREPFDAVQEAMRDRALAVQKPCRVGSKFLLSGLLKCGVCGSHYTGQGAKSGQFAYYVCGTLFRQGAGTCSTRYLNAPRVEEFIVEKVRGRILTEETIVELATLVAEEIDAMAGELAGRLEGRRPASSRCGTVRSSYRLLVRTPQLSWSSGRWSFRPPGDQWIRCGLPGVPACGGRSLSARRSSATSWRTSRWWETRPC